MIRIFDTDLITELAKAMNGSWDSSAWDAIEKLAVELGIDEEVHDLLEEMSFEKSTDDGLAVTPQFEDYLYI